MFWAEAENFIEEIAEVLFTGNFRPAELAESCSIREQCECNASSVLFALHLHFFVSALKSMERVEGIEPSFQAWEAHVLPLNHTRVCSGSLVTTWAGASNRSIALIAWRQGRFKK